jgi:5-methylcytosine-specific restriction enzyme A
MNRPSRHHLVPASEGGVHGPTVVICRSCHDAVHATLDNRTIASEHPSVEALRAHPTLGRTLRFIGRQPPETAVRTRPAAGRRRRRRG